MSKYQRLWEKIAASGEDELTLSFDQVKDWAGVPLDHSFLNYKKELLNYGYQVDHVYLKKRSILIKKLSNQDK